LKLVNEFYNDTYFFDQNACSSPHIIFWFGSDKLDSKNKFWDLMDKCVKKKYKMRNISAIDKYVRLCKTAIDIPTSFEFINHDNYIYRINLKKLSKNIVVCLIAILVKVTIKLGQTIINIFEIVFALHDFREFFKVSRIVNFAIFFNFTYKAFFN